MHRCFLMLLLMFAAGKNFSQTNTTIAPAEQLFAFRITDYTVKLNDTVTVVQVNLPDSFPVLIENDQLAVLRRLCKKGIAVDTNMVGWGKCNLIKEKYYYFSIHHKKGRLPETGDLLYTKMKVPAAYNGLLLKASSHAMVFTKVDDKPFFDESEIFKMTRKKELQVLDSMMSDIRFTGKAMLAKIPAENVTIKTGIYKGRKLFTAMQQVRVVEVEEFLKYIIARPLRYAGNEWKISEVFATWMINNTPIIRK